MATSTKNMTIAQVKGAHLIVESLRDETVIFDRRTNKAHMLDARATAIWNAAENGCSVEDVVSLVEGRTLAEKRATAHLGIVDLERAGLLMSDMTAVPRRGLLKTLGAAAMVPMVISILAPRAEALVSACTLGVTVCTSSAQCCTAAPNCVQVNIGSNCTTTQVKRCCKQAGASKIAGCSCEAGSECCSGTCTSKVCA